MRMLLVLRKLASLLGPRDRLVTLARAADWRAFAQGLADADVHIFVALEGEGLDLETMTSEDLLRETERAAVALSEATGFMPLTYEDQEHRYLPFFSKIGRADV